MNDSASPPRKRARIDSSNEEQSHPFAPHPTRLPMTEQDATTVVERREQEAQTHDTMDQETQTQEQSVSRSSFMAQHQDEDMDNASIAGSCSARMDDSNPLLLPLATASQMLNMEESNTDDEDLQQLTMVVQSGASDDGQESTVGSMAPAEAELCYEDVRNIVFQASRDQKIGTLQKAFRMVRVSKNGGDIMKQLVAAEDETGLTLLMISVRSNLAPLSAFLVQEGANVNYCNEKRSYALLLSAQKGLVEMSNFLLDHGANAESKNMALIPAAHFGHLAVVKLLLAYRADQNYANKKGTTPLMRAAQEGREEVVQFLLESGADACAANNEGMTALMLAAQRGHAKIATMLIRAGSNVNKQTRQGSTALLLAAKRGHTAAVEALLTAGADIFLKDDRDKTPADIAKRRGHTELWLKITVANQLSLMREDLRRQRSFTLMQLSSLYVASRADFAPAYKRQRHQRYHDLLDRTMRLPRPLLQNVALYLPLCGMWDHQLRYLTYQSQSQSNYVVQQGIQMMDEILRSVCLEMKASLTQIGEYKDLQPCGQLALLRDCTEYRNLFTLDARFPMSMEMLQRLRRMADVQGALSAYTPGPAISFGEQVAQDVVALLDELLRWNGARKHAELTVSVSIEELTEPAS